MIGCHVKGQQPPLHRATLGVPPTQLIMQEPLQKLPIHFALEHPYVQGCFFDLQLWFAARAQEFLCPPAWVACASWAAADFLLVTPSIVICILLH